MRTMPLATFFYAVLFLIVTVFQQPLAHAAVVNGNTWKVEQGDTLYSIARALFPGNKATQGKARHDIVSLNPEAFQFGPSSMQGGSLLKLPDYVGKHAEKPEASSAPAIGPDGKWAVKKGDTLFSISRALFPGNKAKQAQVRHDITALNLEVFQSGANNMRVGTMLDLPAYVSKQTTKPTSHPASTAEPTPAAMPSPAAIPSPAPPSQPIVDPDSLPVVKLKPPPQENTAPSAPDTATDKKAPPAGETEQTPNNPLY
jgi:Tfp pilus assembly protein FimV